MQIRRRRLFVPWLGVSAALLLLYLRDLGEKSLWIDEFLSLDFASRDLGGVIGAAAADVHPPAYFVLLHFWIRLFGESDLALRLPSVLFATLSLVLLFLIGRRLYGQRVAAVAVCFAVASPFFLLFSHMARYYSMAMAVSMLSTYLLMLALARRGPIYWLVYALSSSLVLFTDYPAIAVIGAHGVFLIVRYVAGRRLASGNRARSGDLGRWLICMGVCFVSYLPWLVNVVDRVSRGSEGRVSDYAQGPAGIVLKLASFAYSFGVGETIFPWQPLALLALIAVWAAFIFGLLGRHSAERPRRIEAGAPGAIWTLPAVVLGVSLFSTILITILVMPVVTFLNMGSRMMFAFPYFVLLVAVGLVRSGRLAWLAVALIAASNVVSYSNYWSGSSFLNPIYTVPAKQIAADVERMAQPGDLVISTLDSLFDRYFDRTAAVATPHFLISDWAEAKRQIERGQVKRVWLLTLGLDTNRDYFPTEVAGWLRARYSQTERWGYAEQDSLYRAVKEKLLGREAYRYKATLDLYR